MNHNNVEVNILVRGRRATEFKSPLNFQTYIEGRDGSEFEIELVNNNPTDVEAIISVDGLSVTDGKPAGKASTGYLVPARGRVRIPGWTVDKATVAKFFFAGDKGGSYAEKSGQDDRNKGVIGAMVYARKPVFNNTALVASSFQTFGATPKGFGGLRGISSNSMMATPLGSYSNTSSAVGGSLESMVATASAAAPTNKMEQEQERTQTLGTGFGEASDFNTSTVDFERGDLHALVEIFYDDARGLKRYGIDVANPVVRPSAFPADEVKGCVPPSDWKR